MASSNVSPAQIETRRRALGRSMAQKASQISQVETDLSGSPDLQFLTPAEGKNMEKLLKQIETVMGNLVKIGNGLEGK